MVPSLIYCACKICSVTNPIAGRPLRSNAAFIKQASSDQKAEMSEKSPFQSGTWNSQYYQYGSWHGPHHLSLTFTDGKMTVNGSGNDDVGSFTVDGNYSTQTNRLALKKTYRAGTGNRAENLGHTVTIQLEWHSQSSQFEGKWYVRTAKYQGENKFRLKRSSQQYANAHVIV